MTTGTLPGVIPEGIVRLIWYSPANSGANPEKRTRLSGTMTLPILICGRMTVVRSVRFERPGAQIDCEQEFHPSLIGGVTAPRPFA